MKIGFYHDAAGTNHAGGVAVYTQQIAAKLSRSNEVYLYTQRGDLSSIVTNSDVTVIETPVFEDHWSRVFDDFGPLGPQERTKCLMTHWAARNGVLEHIEDHLDVLFTFQFLDDLLLSNLVDVPTVYTFHRLSSVGLGAKLQDAFSQTDVILANSDDTAQRVTSTFDRDVAEIIYPGFDADRFRPGADPAIESDDPIVLFVGRLVDSKGIYDLLEAIDHLDGRQELHFVGSGHEKAELRRRASERGIDDSVVIHGEVRHSALPAYHAGADVFCLPSHDESFGMANVEAMACGLPVVTTALEGIETYLTDGENGLLTPVGDPGALAYNLSMLLESPRIRRRLGRQARRDVQSFTWREQARRLEEFCYEMFDVDESTERPVLEPILADIG